MKKITLLLVTVILIYTPFITHAQPGTVGSFAKISATSGNFSGTLNTNDRFGRNLVNIGDLNGDGIEDLAVGANYDDDGGTNKGAVWILFLNSNGTVNSHQKISIGNGGFTGFPNSVFGTSVGLIGDLNGDGVQDIVVGETDSNDGASQAGAVWILFLNTNGTVNSHQKISSTTGNLNVSLISNGRFGSDVAGIGDIDNDGLPDIAVSQQFGNNGGTQKGAVWILRLNANGTVKAKQEISATTGGFTGNLDIGDNFGSSVANLGDFDNDGINDILVGARRDNNQDTDKGAVWIIYLNANGTVKANQKISSTQGNFTGNLDFSDGFGIASEALGDIDGDNITDIAIGAYLDDDGGTDKGAVWILFMNANGTVKGHQKISNTQGGFNGQLDNQDNFGGWGVSVLNDLNNDGIKDLAVCAVLDDDGGASTGAVWILFLNCSNSSPSGLSVNLGIDTIICNGTLQLDATNANATSYLWQDGSTNSTFNVTQSGNYIVAITDGCLTATDTINVQYYTSQLSVDLGIDTVLCLGENLIVDATNTTATSYLWQDGSTNSTFNITQSGSYFVMVEDSCNIVSDTINVIISDDAPTLDLGENIEICIGEITIVDATTIDANTYLWNDGSTNPILTINTEGQYSVIATNDCGNRQDSIYINVIDCNCYLIVPNAFSPGGNQNLTFYPMTEGVCNFTNYKFMIFNRLGNKVFETNDIVTQWDGIYNNEAQPQDTYTWIIDYELDSGFKDVLKGSVLLIR